MPKLLLVLVWLALGALLGIVALAPAEVLSAIGARFERLRSIALSAAVIIAVVVLVPLAAYEEHRSDRIVLEPIQVPVDSWAGPSPAASTQMLASEVQAIQEAVRTNNDIQEIARQLVQDGRLPDVEVPGLELSLRSLIRYVSASVGWDGQRAGGAFLENGNLLVWMGDSVQEVGGNSPREAIHAGALAIVGQISPCFLASYQIDKDTTGAETAAIRCLNRATSQQDKLSAYLLWAKILQRSGHSRGALDLYEFAERQGLKSCLLYINWGTLLYAQKEFAAARAKFESAKTSDCRRYTALIEMNCGLTHHEERDDTKAIASYELALAASRDGVETSLIRTNLGNALRALADSSNTTLEDAQRLRARAFDDHLQAIAANPLSAYAHNGFGSALLESGSASEALREFELSTTLDPNFPEGYHNAARSLMARRELRAAIDRFALALRKDPRFVPAYTDCAQALVDVGELRRAIAAYTRAIELSPEVADAYIGRGRVHAQRCEFTRAVADFRTALLKNPRSPHAANDLAATLIDRWETNFDDRDLQDAEALLSGVLRQQPTLSFAHAETGRILELRGDSAGAIREYEAATLARHPQSERLRQRIDELHLRGPAGQPRRVKGPCVTRPTKKADIPADACVPPKPSER